MEAAEAKVQRVLEGSRQFLVPHYQRPYSWAEQQWKTLWNDLVELMEDPSPKPHFLGSIVTSPARSVPEGVEKRLLIDGQQRLTTILVLPMVIRDRARETGALRLAERADDLIKNRHEDGNDSFKLLPTQGEDPTDSDRDIFTKLVRGESVTGKKGIAAAYRYFGGHLRRDDAPDIDSLFRIIVVNLTLVSIILDEKDNAHRIFESLNGTGRPLSQVDLIRNYFFMRIDPREHDYVYCDLWRPMQRQLGEDALQDFVRHYLMRSGSTIREADVYVALKLRIDEDAARTPLDHLKDLVRFAGYYDALLHPEKVSGPDVRQRLERLNRLEMTVAYPFLLSVLADHAEGVRDESVVCAAFDAVENYLIRRFVCGVPSHGLNKMFPSLYDQASRGTDFVESLRRTLSSNARHYPRDKEFGELLASARLYGVGERRQKTKLILERLEANAGHKERVTFGALTIEHVMPQTLNDAWKAELGAAWEDEHDQLLHTLGNLTLTSYNAELGNTTFSEKRPRFLESHLELNRYFGTVQQWNADEIQRRARLLIQQALDIWPYFGPKPRGLADNHLPIEQPTGAPAITGTTPRLLRMAGKDIEVQSWVDVWVATMEGILKLGEEEFRQVIEEIPKVVSFEVADLRRGSRSRRLSNGAHLSTNLSAASIYRRCLQALRVAGVAQDDWLVVHDRQNRGDSGATGS